jgi:Kef-type K+ transport system membrane component KefB
MAILLFGLALAGDRAIDTANDYGLSLVEWALLIGAAGGITGLLFMIFIGGAEDDVRLYLATLGVVIFSAGIGAALGVSPLFVNMVAGLTVAATSVHGDRLRTNLDQLQRPTSILLLVFAGIAWRPVTGWLWLLPLAYLLARISMRLLASNWAVSTFVHGAELRRVGGGLLGQGSLAAAIALSYAQGHPELANVVLNAVLLPMLITDLFAVRTLRVVLANAGAIRPRAKLAREELVP